MHAAGPGVTVFERGWLSSNNVLLHDAERGALLVDSSHVLHGAQTVALLRHALAGAPLAGVVNTHLHSDHCGGNAAVQRAFGCRVTVPPGHFGAVQAWDTDTLGYGPTGQLCERFAADAALQPGEHLEAGGRRWLALAAPGHDPHSLVLFDAMHGVLISADALWANGFGVVFPELDGEQAFDEVGATLDLIEALAPKLVIPGHGAPFDDLAGALARARSRLDAFRADPRRHDRHALKVLLKYHLMERRAEPWPQLLDWFAATPLCAGACARLGHAGAARALGEALARELIAAGVLAERDGVLHDA